jgi:hypothetical protein
VAERCTDPIIIGFIEVALEDTIGRQETRSKTLVAEALEATRNQKLETRNK